VHTFGLCFVGGVYINGVVVCVMGRVDLKVLEALVDRLGFLGAPLTMNDMDTMFRQACGEQGVEVESVMYMGWTEKHYKLTSQPNSKITHVKIIPLSDNGYPVGYDIFFTREGANVTIKGNIHKNATVVEGVINLGGLISRNAK